MSHKSIALVKRKIASSKEAEPEYSFLIKDLDSQIQFLSFENLALNASFNFRTLAMNVVGELEFGYLDRQIDKLFQRYNKFRSRRIEPKATSYEFYLTPEQANHVDNLIQLKSNKWRNYLWVEQSDLKKLSAKWKDDQKFLFEKVNQLQQSQFSNEIRADFTRLKTALLEDKLVIFAGAGVSYDSNLPDWKALVSELKQDLDTTETSFLKIAEQYSKVRGRSELLKRVQKILKHGMSIANPLHEQIIRLAPTHVITTNYDSHFEDVINENGQRYSVVRQNSDLPFCEYPSMLIKMHGDFNAKNIVVTESDYEDYKQKFALINGFVEGLFASKLILFIGFSFDDPNLQEIVSTLESILGEHNQKPYLLRVFNNVNGIVSGDITGSDKSKKYDQELKRIDLKESDIENYFAQIATLEDSRNIKRIGEIGRATYKFLRILETFDIFYESLSIFPVQKQLAESLGRFRSLGFIPHDVLAIIPPFSVKRMSTSDLEINASIGQSRSFHLETYNERLLSYLEEESNENQEVEFVGYSDRNASMAEQKISLAFRLLYSSGIQCIIRKSDTNPQHFKLRPKISDKECQCFRCQLSRLEYSELIDTLISRSTRQICNDGTEANDLFYAYAYFHTGQIAKSYFALLDLKQVALRNRDFITYFISCYNLVRLFPYLDDYYDESLSEGEYLEIVDKIRNVDLDEIISDLPIDNHQRTALKSIKENRTFEKAHFTIGVIHKHLKGLQKNPGNRPLQDIVNWEEAEYNHFNVNNYFNANLLFEDSDHVRKLTVKYVEVIIATHISSVNSIRTVSNVSDHFISCLVHVLHTHEIRKLFTDYRLDILLPTNGTLIQSRLLAGINSLTKSGFKEREGPFSYLTDNPEFTYLLKSRPLFKDRITQKFNSTLFVLSRFDISTEEAREVIRITLKFLEYNEIIEWHEDAIPFSEFISKNVGKLDGETLNNIFVFGLTQNIWANKFLLPICKALDSKSIDIPEFGNGIYDLAIRRVTDWEVKQIVIGSLVCIYKFLPPKSQRKFSDQLFKSNLSMHILKEAHIWGIWKPKENNRFYKMFVSNIESNCKNLSNISISIDGIITLKHSHFDFQDLRFLIVLVYNYGLFNRREIVRIRDQVGVEIVKWALSPKQFDYDKFEISWLYAFELSSMANTLSDIKDLKRKILQELKMKTHLNILELVIQYNLIGK